MSLILFLMLIRIKLISFFLKGKSVLKHFPLWNNTITFFRNLFIHLNLELKLKTNSLILWFILYQQPLKINLKSFVRRRIFRALWTYESRFSAPRAHHFHLTATLHRIFSTSFWIISWMKTDPLEKCIYCFINERTKRSQYLIFELKEGKN